MPNKPTRRRRVNARDGPDYFHPKGQGLFLKKEQPHPKTMKKMWRQAGRCALARSPLVVNLQSKIKGNAKEKILERPSYNNSVAVFHLMQRTPSQKRKSRAAPPHTPPSTQRNLKNARTYHTKMLQNFMPLT